MISKITRVIYNGIRFVGKKNYKNLLCVSTSTKIDVSRSSIIQVGKGFRTRRNVEINARDNAAIKIGDNVFINTGCIITAREKIEIGDGTILAPNVMIYDNDHKFVDGKAADNEFDTDAITIGSHVWIGAGAIVLKGTVIEDNCVIAAGSVVKGNVKKGTIMVQKRNTTMIPIH